MEGKLRALAFLLVSGFLAGFILTRGAENYFRPASASAAPPKSQAGDEGGAPRRALRTGDKHGEMPQEAGRKAAAAAAPPASSSGKGGKGLHDGDDESPGGERPLAGSKAIDFVTGNTLVAADAAGGAARYVAARQWMAETAGAGLVVRRWAGRGGRLCLLEPDETPHCAAVKVQPVADAPAGPGAMIGSAQVGETRWTVLRGNARGMPDRIPLIDGGRRVSGAAPDRPTRSGREAMDELGAALLLAEGKAVRGTAFEPGGRLLEARLLPRARTPRGGVRVEVGLWRLEDGRLCMTHGADGTRDCVRPERWGPAAFRLVAFDGSAPRRLAVMAEGP